MAEQARGEQGQDMHQDQMSSDGAGRLYRAKGAGQEESA